ncbi:helix-turn-helix domain-containing protein [Mucilaginibacter auburnensis]|uniref:Helix-turn-helix protein n=1 Tax=Mucilaginibacter auburnensis TaxID=1457233 RepID=A0A2H9VRU7_9SPHI|nr:AraC family transcriptional regulator [Mucilaginibacter auburnensis]PJJ83557.1 helix-turn-helix protein [Mucilaginibacter auburnensis]
MVKRILKHSFSLLNTDHVKLGKKWNYKNVISPYHRIYFIDDGDGEISNQEETLKLEPGYLYLIPSFTLCDLTCSGYMSQYFVQFFEESSDGISLFANSRSLLKTGAQEIDVINFRRLVEINPGRGINRSDNPKVYEKNAYYNEYQELNNLQNIGDFLETQGILLQLVSRFAINDVFKQKEVKYIPVKVLEAISFIALNLNNSLTVKFLADRANLNVDYFSRLFQQATGCRPAAYINQKKIERAQYLIVTSSSNYETIAEIIGFESLSHFSKTFKKFTGMTPREFKRHVYHSV